MARKSTTSNAKLTAAQRKVLSDLDKKDNLKPEVVVSLASNPNNPLHSMFNWDDPSAAHSYRLWQARQLISSYRVVVIINKKPREVKLYYEKSRKPEDGGGYASATKLASSPEATDRALLTMLRRISSELVNAINLAEMAKRNVRNLQSALDSIDNEIAALEPVELAEAAE
jgi:hypothetical protein